MIVEENEFGVVTIAAATVGDLMKDLNGLPLNSTLEAAYTKTVKVNGLKENVGIDVRVRIRRQVA
jgi:hypothetical protein